MIDRERKIIFVHLPKTGGSTIESMLVGSDDVGFHDRPDSEVLTLERYRGYFPLGRHATLSDYEALLGSEGDSLRNYRVFATVRDPRRQLVSQFKFRRQKFFGREGFFAPIRNLFHRVLYTSFAVFLSQTLLLYALMTVIPVASVYRRCKRLGLSRIFLKNESAVVVKVFRLEDISQDPSPIYAYLDLPPGPPLKKLNKTKASAGINPDNKLLGWVAGIVYKNRIRDFYSDETPPSSRGEDPSPGMV